MDGAPFCSHRKFHDVFRADFVVVCDESDAADFHLFRHDRDRHRTAESGGVCCCPVVLHMQANLRYQHRVRSAWLRPDDNADDCEAISHRLRLSIDDLRCQWAFADWAGRRELLSAD